MKPFAVLSLLASCLTLLTACSVSPPQITAGGDPAGDDDAAPAGNDTAASGDDAGPGPGSERTEGGTAPVDTQTDARNCGAIGHDCGGAACGGGLCAPATVRSEAGPFAVTGTTMFQLGPGHTLLSGATTPNATTTTIATLDPVCATGTKRIFTTPSYVFVDCGTKLQVVSRSTHVVTTVVFDSSPQNRPWGSITANDSLMFYFDGDQGDVWQAQTPTGSFVHTYATMGTSAMVAHPNGVYTVSNDDFGGSSVFHLQNGSKTVTPVASAVGESFTIAYNTTSVIGATDAGSSTCDGPNPASRVWSAPRAGGSVQTLADVPFRVGQILADDHGLVLLDACEKTVGGVLSEAVWSLPTTGGKPVLLTARNVYNAIAMDASWVYVTLDESPSDVVARVHR